MANVQLKLRDFCADIPEIKYKKMLFPDEALAFYVRV